jgi:type I restriction enzyme R subunit
MQTDEGTTIKVVPRYQQYRAVCKAIHGLKTGKTKQQDGLQDRRGGVVWHTQGSGKSLTMVFLVRKLRNTPVLANTKVVIVTDRKQLQDQLFETMRLTDEHIDEARRVSQAKTKLSRHGAGVLFVMIQKQQDVQARKQSSADDLADSPSAPPLGELNTDESILVLIDEAHRSHSSTLHKNLLKALPNCARIGFTGTPIIRRAKKTTLEIFGNDKYIDVYKLADAEQDGAVVPVLYSGQFVRGAVHDGRDMDEFFEDMFAELTDDERQKLQQRYATKGDVMESKELIAAKARSMLRHYVAAILPNGFKAQLVAYSRRAAVRYRDALVIARDELIKEIEALPDATRGRDPEDLPRRQAFLVRAVRHLDLIRAMDFIPVISPDQNDGPEYTAWTDPVKQKAAIDAFVKPFPEEADQGIKPPSFLIVKSMLLTGFDAPVEQVLYLDRSMRDAELLQAVARVNRPAGARKKNGFVMDYVGITRHLTDALKAYSSEDVQGVLRNINDEIGHLGPRRDRVRMLFTSHGVTAASGEARIEDCVALLEDPQLRDEFETDLREFASTVDTVLPLPDVDPYLPDLKLFTEVALRARRRYRVDDGTFDPGLYGEKVRELLDEHIISLGVEQTLPPVSVTSPDFRRKVEAMTSHRARASEMKHAIRHHIEVHFGEDPARYRRLSERLEQILAEQKENWEEQASLLSELLDDIESGPAGPSSDEPSLGEVEYALYGVLLEETATDGVITLSQQESLGGAARGLYDLARRRTTRVAFWTKLVDQEDFKRELAAFLASGEVCPPAQAMKVADRLFDVIKANRRRIQRPGPGG